MTATDRLTADELALRLGLDADRVARYVARGAVEPGSDGRFDAGDVHRVRLVDAFERAGVPLEALVAASRAGEITLAYYDQLHPPPGSVSGRPYAAFAASLGDGATLLPRLFAAFGLAEPAPDTRLNLADEALLAELVRVVEAIGHVDLALRAVRLFGEGARRSAEGALGVYGEAVERLGIGLQGLPAAEAFERVLRPWARFARLSPDLGAWLTSRHVTHAIDEYSVSATEDILEASGFVAPRLEAPPSVAFVDLTGFTRLTEERGDEVAAEIAVRLGEVTAEIVGMSGGRVVKLLGDGVLVLFDDAPAAADATLSLLAALPGRGLPSGHAGVASGPLIARDGDVFGRTVNLAARIADAAPDGRLYASRAAAEALSAGRFVVRPVERTVLQGIGRVELVEVARAE
jgi:adenylate cyclase